MTNTWYRLGENPDGTLFTGEVSMSVAPRDFLPMPLPPGEKPPLIINIQPAGLKFDSKAELTFPNVLDLPPGSRVDLKGPDDARNVITKEGVGEVTADGERIVTVEGGLDNERGRGIG